MTLPIFAAAAVLIAGTAIHLASIIIAIRRCAIAPTPPSRFRDGPPVTIIRPVCGLENHIEETLASTFALDYPRYDVIFCAASPRDPAIPLVERLIGSHPLVPARLLVGNEEISTNPKLNNICKGWRAASSDWVVMADSNVLMPRDYIARLFSTWETDTGLVSAPPIGCRPAGFWAELECAFLNTYQARWQYTADSIGMGFAQGKTLAWRRRDLEHAGGIGALASEHAEDAAATKLVRDLGLRVRLVDTPFGQPLGRRSASEVWRRQMRWARLRRASFPGYFLWEILSGGIIPAALMAFIAEGLEISVVGSVLGFGALWYGAEMSLSHAAGWHLSARSALHAVLRDLLLPVLWFGAWTGSVFVWRGNAMSIAQESRAS